MQTHLVTKVMNQNLAISIMAKLGLYYWYQISVTRCGKISPSLWQFIEG